MTDLLSIWRTVEMLPIKAALGVQWRALLRADFEALEPYLRPEPQLASRYPCPNPVHEHCPRHVMHRASGELVAVCGNPDRQCDPVKLERADLVVRVLSPKAWATDIVRMLQQANGLSPLSIDVPAGFVSLGQLCRRGRRLAVVWARREMKELLLLARGIRAGLGSTDLVVMLPPAARRATDALIANMGIVLLTTPDCGHGQLGLHRALDLLDPSYRTRRLVDPTTVFDDIRLELREERGCRHVVRLDGHIYKGFQKSDLKFLRLLMLAAARKLDHDAEGGGWLDKHKLQGDEKDHDLEAVREELCKYEHPTLSQRERASLIKRSVARDGKVRLALAPENIVLDVSLADFKCIGPQQSCPSAAKRSSGQAVRAANFAVHERVAKRLLAELSKLGVLGCASEASKRLLPSTAH